MINQLWKKFKWTFLPLSEKDRAMREWKRPENQKLTYTHDLNPDSIIFDLGGYKGQWASDIFSMYLGTIYIFEPVRAYYEDIEKRFEKNPKIKVFNFGLAGTTIETSIGMANDGSSIFNKSSAQQERIQLKKAFDFLKDNSITRVDLAKINIEGGEYDLLEHLLDTGLVKDFKNIQVQFHDFVPNAEARMKAIQERLAVTHKLTYQAKFIWENWERK